METLGALRQYGLHIPGEYLERLVADLSRATGISIDLEPIRGTPDLPLGAASEVGYALFRHTRDPEIFILVDLEDVDILNAIVVRCRVETSPVVKEVMLRWDALARAAYDDTPRSDLQDTLDDPDSDARIMAERYGLDL